MTMIKVDIREDIKVFKDGDEIAISQKKLRAIVAFFVVDKSVDRQAFADTFFNGRKNLIRNSVYMINKSFGFDFISNIGRETLALNNRVEYDIDIDYKLFLSELKFKNEPFFKWKQNKMQSEFYVNQEILNTVYYDFLKEDSQSFLINGKNGVGKTEFISRLFDNVKANKMRIKCTSSEQNFSLNIIHIMLNYLCKYENKDFLKVFTDINYNDKKAFKDENNLLNLYYLPIIDLLINILREELNHKYLVIIEDLEYIDDSSLEIINRIIESNIPNIVFVMTYNTTSKRDIDVSGSVKQHIISNWSMDDVCKYIDFYHSEYSSYCEKIYEYTKGNPFYIEVMINNLIHSSTLSLSRDYLADTLNCLSDVEVKIVKYVSCFNGSVHLDNICKTFDVEKSVVEKLEEDNILETRQVNDKIKVTFKHSILKEYIYNHLNDDEKRHYHLLIAYIVEGKYIKNNLLQTYELYYHYQKANDILKMTEYHIKYLSLVSSYTHSVFPTTDKFDFITDDHDIENKLAGKLNDLEYIINENDILRNNNKILVEFYTLKNRYDIITGELSGVRENILKQVELCTLIDDEQELVKAYYLMIYYGLNIGDYECIDNYLNLLNKVFPIDKDPITKRIQGYNYILKGEYHKSIFTLNEAIDLSYKLPKELAETNLVACYAYLGEAHIITHDYKRALKDLMRGEKIVNESAKFISGSILIKLFMAISHYRLGDNKKALEYINYTYKTYDQNDLCWKRCSCYLYARQIYRDCKLDYTIFNSKINNCNIKYHTDLGKWLYKEYCKEENQL